MDAYDLVFDLCRSLVQRHPRSEVLVGDDGGQVPWPVILLLLRRRLSHPYSTLPPSMRAVEDDERPCLRMIK
jgi:hypothetical protein